MDVSWRIDNSADRLKFHFEWRESGGPQVEEPTKPGLGTRLLRQALSGAVTDLAFQPEGVIYRLEVLLTAIAGGPNEANRLAIDVP
jgi:two-component sensor histidine kinase